MMHNRDKLATQRSQLLEKKVEKISKENIGRPTGGFGWVEFCGHFYHDVSESRRPYMNGAKSFRKGFDLLSQTPRTTGVNKWGGVGRCYHCLIYFLVKLWNLLLLVRRRYPGDL